MRTRVVLFGALLGYLGFACSEEVGLGGTDGEAGASGEAGAPAGTTGGSAGVGAGGTGATEPNTCPPSLIHTGAAPGILCERTGDTCADSETFCHCGDLTIEGRPWSCVPTLADCPAMQPDDGDACSAETPELCHYVDTTGRVDCRCAEGVFDCGPSDCPITNIDNGARCDVAGQECAYFRANFPGSTAGRNNVPCVCEDGFWSCNDGCPKDFTGEGGECDPALGFNCSFRTDEGLLVCGCGSEPAQWNCVSGGDR